MAYGHEDHCPHPGYACTCKCAGRSIRLTDGWLKEDMEKAAQRVKDFALHDEALATLRALANSPHTDWPPKSQLHKQFQKFK